MLISRIEFESSQLRSTRERLDHLRATVEAEEVTVGTLRASRQEVEEQLEQLNNEVDQQRRRLGETTETYDAATNAVEEQRESARKTQKTLDRALKEIAEWNDEIEKSDSSRHAIYRRCRLEEIDLPLVSGRLDKVPIEEVCQFWVI